MELHRLRIACSVFCGVVFVSLVVLWVASYFSRVYIAKRLATTIVSLQASRGELGVWTTSPLVPGPDVTWGIGNRSLEKGVSDHFDEEDSPQFELFGFRYETMPPIASVFFIPFWALLVTAAAAGVMPWVKWQIGWRAAASAACLIVALLSVGLWARSYKWFDITDRTSAANICSMNGRLLIGETFMLTGGDSLNPAAPVPPSHLGICTLSPAKFTLLPMGDGVALPYWFVIVVAGLVGAMPWLRFRFSLRAMLVGTAVVAAILFGVLAVLKR